MLFGMPVEQLWGSRKFLLYYRITSYNVCYTKLLRIYIAERDIGPAFDGDMVEVVLFADQRGKNLTGQIHEFGWRGIDFRNFG